MLPSLNTVLILFRSVIHVYFTLAQIVTVFGDIFSSSQCIHCQSGAAGGSSVRLPLNRGYAPIYQDEARRLYREEEGEEQREGAAEPLVRVSEEGA
jgi:hypothetical protein